jgi:hypothetical protein
VTGTGTVASMLKVLISAISILSHDIDRWG